MSTFQHKNGFKQIIDQESIDALLDIADGDQKFIDDIFNLFFNGGQIRIEKMESLFQAKEFKSCASEAHAFKSSAFSVGAFGLSQICFEIEHGSGPNLDPGTFQALRASYEASCTELRKIHAEIKLKKSA